MKGGYALSEFVSVAITVVNSIIQAVMSVLIKMVGHHTESEQITAIMVAIFFGTFFNTALLLILADATFKD